MFLYVGPTDDFLSIIKINIKNWTKTALGIIFYNWDWLEQLVFKIVIYYRYNF